MKNEKHPTNGGADDKNDEKAYPERSGLKTRNHERSDLS